ncbi:M23 family metallopeptidase [Phenylobacterium sp.]|uniref:M23 family metallopeptidase n=1 Tax=Phenylobacterium sp. TaxID=1871053 RepID=UPI00289CCD85|nr:M23 family metallopeptidase [Phenylobacterium sp.]
MSLAAHGGMRHFWVEGLLAIALTLCVVTAAYATTVFSPSAAPPEPTYAKVVAQVPPPPPPPEFQFGEPVPGHAVNSPFGLRKMSWEKHGRLHHGVDIAAPAGVKVVAVEDGVIVRSGSSPSYGRFVEVKHAGGLTSFYAHLGRIEKAARAGAPVSAGTVIGRIGSSGISTGPHLHFEIRRGETPLNPVAFMGREFATAEDLPLKSAAYYPKKVRVAQASRPPAGKRQTAVKTDGGRVMASLEVGG